MPGQSGHNQVTHSLPHLGHKEIKSRSSGRFRCALNASNQYFYQSTAIEEGDSSRKCRSVSPGKLRGARLRSGTQNRFPSGSVRPRITWNTKEAELLRCQVRSTMEMSKETFLQDRSACQINFCKPPGWELRGRCASSIICQTASNRKP